MNMTIPIGGAFALLQSELGRAGAIGALRSALFNQTMTSLAAQFHATLTVRNFWHDAPPNGADRPVPHIFWGASWGGEGEWTETELGCLRHFKSNWPRGDFALIEEYGQHNNIVRAEGVSIGSQEFATLCATLGINAQRAGGLGHLTEWVTACDPRSWKAGWRKYKDQLGSAAEKRAVFRVIWETQHGILQRGRQAASA